MQHDKTLQARFGTSMLLHYTTLSFCLPEAHKAAEADEWLSCPFAPPGTLLRVGTMTCLRSSPLGIEGQVLVTRTWLRSSGSATVPANDWQVVGATGVREIDAWFGPVSEDNDHTFCLIVTCWVSLCQSKPNA